MNRIRFSRLDDFGRRILNLQPGEGRRLAYLFLLGFIVSTSLVWGAAIGRSLFLSRVGIEWLPLMFVFDAVVTFLITLVYTAFVDRVSNERLLAWIFGGVGVILVFAWGLLYLDHTGVNIPYVLGIYALLYVAERVLRALFAVHVWTYFNDYFDITSAKRTFPILGSTSRIAGIVSGALLTLMTAFVIVENLILAWAALLAFGAWLSISIPHWLANERANEPPPGRKMKRMGPSRSRPSGSSVTTSWQGYLNNLAGGFQFVSKSSFLRLLAVAAFAMTALLALVDYQASRVLVQVYPTAESLAAFYGILESVTNVIALPLQMLLVSRLVAWWGVSRTNLLFPTTTLFAYVALSVWPSLGTAIFGQFSKDALRSSVQVPVDNMLYNAVPPAVKGRARAFVKGLLVPLATILVGLVLMPIRQEGTLPEWLIGIGVALAIVHLVAATYVRRRYTRALVNMLSAGDYSAYRLAGSQSKELQGPIFGPPDPTTFRALVDRLRSSAHEVGAAHAATHGEEAPLDRTPDPDADASFAAFLARTVAEIGGPQAGPPLVEVAQTTSGQIQASILVTLCETDIVDRLRDPWAQNLKSLCYQLLSAEDPEYGGEVRRAALATLERLLGADDPDLWSASAPLLRDPVPETRLAAIVLLARSGEPSYTADAERALAELLAADGSERSRFRVAALRRVRDLADDRVMPELIPFLDDPDDEVRLSAALAIEDLADRAPVSQADATAPVLWPWPGTPSSDPSKSPSPGAAKRWALEAAVRELADPMESIRLCGLRTLGKSGGAEILAPLLDALYDPSELVREHAQRELAALGSLAIPSLQQILNSGEWEGEHRALWHSSLEPSRPCTTPERVRQAAALTFGRMASEGILPPSEAQPQLRRCESFVEDTVRRIYADTRLIAALPTKTLTPKLSTPAPESPINKKQAPVGLDLLTMNGAPDRHTTPKRMRPQKLQSGRQREKLAGKPAELLPSLTLLQAGLAERNEQRLSFVFRMLADMHRGHAAEIDVIAGHLLGKGQHHRAASPGLARAHALEALESITSPRLVQLLGPLTDGRPVADLVSTAQEVWDLEPLAASEAIEIILKGSDRWLAAIAIVLLGQSHLLDRVVLTETWFPLWRSDPDPAVREAASYTARLLQREAQAENARGQMEAEMKETKRQMSPVPPQGVQASTSMAEDDIVAPLSAVERAIFLKQVPFFVSMSVEQLHSLAAIADEQYHNDGDLIYDQGEPGEELFVIVSGRVSIERQPKRGRVQRLDTLMVRQYFGERTIFDAASHENRAVALGSVHLLVIHRDPLLALIRRAPDLALSLVTILSQRLREADAKLAARTRAKPDQVMKLYDQLTEGDG